jgi:diadenosine tetraphosphate (Ap4A) HIT family hydrolase
MNFLLHPNLVSKPHVCDLPLCRLLLEDECHYPWLLLVPRRPALSRLIDLAPDDQLLLFQELDLVQRLLWQTFSPHQLNVAAIGNRTPQLHLHVIARYENDPAWPGTVWDHPVRARYEKELLQARLTQLRSALHPESLCVHSEVL